METFTDGMNNISWEYRQGGRDDAHEAVVLVTSIYETTNCLYLLGMELLSAGHRLLLVSIPVCSSVLGLRSASVFLRGSSSYSPPTEPSRSQRQQSPRRGSRD
jgi:hypothetical protein